ncbi:hypothetical protein GE061_010298 [Apolygus lucorum]|uniref:CCHC-type domain-containing protein n=1 Tax=Apolygus lucorum TaxID=248454 RepID=A0A8S9Y2L7_APOLU|nr:hypothetical protein GE061_010298 [Apolygus lucorum]
MVPKKNKKQKKQGSPEMSEDETSQIDEGAVSLKPPSPLVVNNDSNMTIRWKQWLKRFEWFAEATNLYKKSSKKQIATFMATIGEDALTIYDSFGIDNDDVGLIEIKEHFTNYFVKKLNIIYERFLFNNISQADGETFNDFLTNVQNQANKCDYGSIKDNLVRDRLVCGIFSNDTREKLFEAEDLTLDKCIRMCRSAEEIRCQMSKMSGNGRVVNYIKRPPNLSSSNNKPVTDDTFLCSRCGTRHGRRSCPAYQNKCAKCGRLGHVPAMCRSRAAETKAVKTLSLDETNSFEQVNSLKLSKDQVFLVNSLASSTSSRDWTEQLILPKGNKVMLKLDTGAQCNVINEKIANKSRLTITGSPVNHIISYTNDKLPVLGQCSVNVVTKLKEPHLVKFIVVGNDFPAILGRESCQNLGFIKRIQDIEISSEDSNIFQGIGCLKNFEYDLDIIDNPNLKIFPPRRIPYSIRDEVKRELDSMVELGIIKPVIEPTPAVSPMVVVRQKDKVRICLDPSDLNKNIQRRHHPLQTLEEIAARISGSKFFTLLDCKKGFW